MKYKTENYYIKKKKKLLKFSNIKNEFNEFYFFIFLFMTKKNTFLFLFIIFTMMM